MSKRERTRFERVFAFLQLANQFNSHVFKPFLEGVAQSESGNLYGLLHAAGGAVVLVFMKLLRIGLAMTSVSFRDSTESLIYVRSTPNPRGLEALDTRDPMAHFY